MENKQPDKTAALESSDTPPHLTEKTSLSLRAIRRIFRRKSPTEQPLTTPAPMKQRRSG